MLIAALLIYAVILCACTAKDKADGGSADLCVRFFDMGKADSMLLDCGGKYMLIDCGEKNSGKELVKALKEQGIDELEYLVITHFDKDHVGGAEKVLKNLRVKNVLQNSREKNSDEYEDYVEAVSAAEVKLITVRDEYSFDLNGTGFRVTAGAGGYDKDKSNNFSLVVTADHEGISFLFAGDIQSERIEEMLADGAEHADILKIPHHGGEEEELPALLNALTPSVAVITSSDEEPESESTMEALKEAGVKTYLTREGTVCINVKNGNYEVKQ